MGPEILFISILRLIFIKGVFPVELSSLGGGVLVVETYPSTTLILLLLELFLLHPASESSFMEEVSR